MKTLLFLLLFFSVSPAFAQNVYTLDSTATVTAADTVTYASARVGCTRPLSAAYFHRGNNVLTIVLHDVPPDIFFRGTRAVSIPVVANGTYVGTMDSSYSGTVNLMDAASDTLTAPVFNARFLVGAAHVWIAFLSSSNTSIGSFLYPSTTVAFIKQ